MNDLAPVTIRIIGAGTIDRASIVGQRLIDLREAVVAKLNGIAIDLLEGDDQMAARAVVELNMQIDGAIRALLGQGVPLDDDDKPIASDDGNENHD